MSHISINHPHALDHQSAIEEAEQLLNELSQEYGVTIQNTEENQYAFAGSGVEGIVEVKPECIDVQAKLGFLAMAIKPVLEAKIQEKLQKHFPQE
jgi:putative polyhydroxyalkanoate system protein